MKTNYIRQAQYKKGFIGTFLLILIGIGLVYGGWMLLSKNSFSFTSPDKTSEKEDTTTLPVATTNIPVSTATTSVSVGTTSPDVLKTYTVIGTAGKYSFKYSSPKFTLEENAGNVKGQTILTTADNMIKIVVRPIVIKSSAYKTALINDVVFDGSGKHPNSFTEFTQRTIGGKDFYYIPTGRFEGVLSLNYYFVSANVKEAILFEVISQGVDWTNPKLDVENDKGNLALKQILSTFAVVK